jgi:hypothetical protein
MVQQDVDFTNSHDRHARISDDFKLKSAAFELLPVVFLM